MTFCFRRFTHLVPLESFKVELLAVLRQQLFAQFHLHSNCFAGTDGRCSRAYSLQKVGLSRSGG